MVEFREGVELLKNEYPEKALVRLRRAFESDKRNPYYISFLGLSMARAEQKWDHASELCEMAVQLKRNFHLNLVEVMHWQGGARRHYISWKWDRPPFWDPFGNGMVAGLFET